MTPRPTPQALPPPRLADALLRWSLPSGTLGLSIIGDLHQEYGEITGNGSLPTPRMWYWRWAMGTPMRYVPYGVEATDALVYVLIAVTLGSAGFLACFLPARAAARADPVETMRVY